MLLPGLHIYDRWYPVLDGWGGHCSVWKAKYVIVDACILRTLPLRVND